MARAQELAAFGMQPFPHRLKLFRGDFAAQSKEFRTTALPLTLYAAVFIVVVAVFEMALRIANAAGHGPNSEHSPTVALFEMRLQALYALHRWSRPGGMFLHSPSQKAALDFRLAALVVEQDTIPKPHGLAILK